MAQSWNSWCQQLGLVSAFAIAGPLMELPLGITASSGNYALAQIKPDATLGSERSAVTRDGSIKGLPSDRIEGGAKRGANLFHSFEEFSIDQGQGAYFTNPAGIENILSRVTGNNRSDIQGTLGVLGKANLFLINPNGIIFGPNSSLDVNGSFVATTANAIQFDNQGFFNASTPDALPVLTVNPSAFFFNQIPAQSITNQSVSGLQVPDSQSLLLVGGEVKLNSGSLLAGQVEVAGVANVETVGLNVDGNDLSLSFLDDGALADVSLMLVALPEKELVDVSGLIVQRCPVGGGVAKRAASKFVVTGRGGLPPSPSDPPSSDVVLADWITLDPKMEKPRSGPAPTPHQRNSEAASIVEAQGWVRGPGGEIVLTAQAPTVTPHSSGLDPASCQRL